MANNYVPLTVERVDDMLRQNSIENGWEINVFATMWGSIENVQPFFPLTAHETTGALELIRIPRHLRIINEWKDKNLKLYVSFYQTINEKDVQLRYFKSSQQSKQFDHLLTDPYATLAQYEALQNTIPEGEGSSGLDIEDRIGMYAAMLSKEAMSLFKETIRYRVDIDALLKMVETPSDKTYYTDVLGTVLFTLPTRIIPIPVFLNPLRSPNRYSKALPLEISLGQEVGPSLDVLQFQNLSNDVIYYIALFMNSAELFRLCEVSARLHGLFCEESVNGTSFWIMKYRYDVRMDLPEELKVSTALVRKSYFDRMLLDPPITKWDNVIVTGRFYFDVLVMLAQLEFPDFTHEILAEFLSQFGIEIVQDKDNENYYSSYHLKIPDETSLDEIANGEASVLLKAKVIELLTTIFTGEHFYHQTTVERERIQPYAKSVSILSESILKTYLDPIIQYYDMDKYLDVVRYIVSRQL